MKPLLITSAAAVALGCTAVQAADVKLYGRIDLSLAQQADKAKNTELRNGSGSRLGVRGSEDLGSGLSVVFHLQHRLNADTGDVSKSRFWDGKSIVGLKGSFGLVSFGREQNPAYTYGQNPADPWGGDTVASNGSIVNGRIGSTRYSDSINYDLKSGALRLGAQIAEGNGQDERPYSLGLSWAGGGFTLGVGYENPGDKDDDWLAVSAVVKLGGMDLRALYGSGDNSSAQRHQSWLLAATGRIGAGQWRISYGELKNKTAGVAADKQFGLGYHHKLSKRTTIYADLVHEGRPGQAAGVRSTGYDLGIKHNF